MEIFHTLIPPSKPLSPLVLTIGNFDGMHRGHQRLFEEMAELKQGIKGKLALITFDNHPSEILRAKAIPLITSQQHKIQLLEQSGIDYLILLTFTSEFSLQTPEEFLDYVYAAFPFRFLVLGHDAKIGRDKSGDRQRVEKHLKHLGAEVRYLDAFQVDQQVVSSSLIRQHIDSGDLEKARQLLGRPYSIVAPVISGLAHGKQIGFPTLNFNLTGLCLPPQGVYAVWVRYKNQQLRGVANLGIAPTIRKDEKVLLEVHLLDFNEQLYGESIEVIFHSYLRPERRFSDIKQLQNQIQEDIQVTKKLLMSELLA